MSLKFSSRCSGAGDCNLSVYALRRSRERLLQQLPSLSLPSHSRSRMLVARPPSHGHASRIAAAAAAVAGGKHAGRCLPGLSSRSPPARARRSPRRWSSRSRCCSLRMWSLHRPARRLLGSSRTGGSEEAQARRSALISPLPHALHVRIVSGVASEWMYSGGIQNLLANDFFFLTVGVFGRSSAVSGEVRCGWRLKLILVALYCVSHMRARWLSRACHKPEEARKITHRWTD